VVNNELSACTRHFIPYTPLQDDKGAEHISRYCHSHCIIIRHLSARKILSVEPKAVSVKPYVGETLPYKMCLVINARNELRMPTHAYRYMLMLSSTRYLRILRLKPSSTMLCSWRRGLELVINSRFGGAEPAGSCRGRSHTRCNKGHPQSNYHFNVFT
jgi:hypothetical protein